MTSSIQNSEVLAPDRLMRGFDLTWQGLRRNRSGSGDLLQRVQFHVSVEPVDHAHVIMASWLEFEGGQAQSFMQPAACPMRILCEDGLLHADVLIAGQSETNAVLAVTLNAADQRLIYARFSRLCEAGLNSGSFDAPTVRLLSLDVRTARTA